ncbi:hypothetical protein GOP47_0017372 [Adiantum capillus-veneris]|uniref:Uncharacterized protein n=1 Tax=Adiantum capillus-veneris TaxID=13818 RepID=A0A9D4UF80_ADICA|nr:hypothetical protein GOP47_0017372 [Adiantum capillus-veneris]
MAAEILHGGGETGSRGSSKVARGFRAWNLESGDWPWSSVVHRMLLVSGAREHNQAGLQPIAKLETLSVADGALENYVYTISSLQ